jgi:hypothetical protein
MNGVVSAGDAFIWITSIAAGTVLVLAGYRAIWSRSLAAEKKNLLGEWFGYAHFHATGGDRFYKERIIISRNRWLPWRLRIEAEPIPSAGETVYRGEITLKSPVIFCEMFEPIYSDRTFEIGHRVMDHSDCSGPVIAGLYLGNSYQRLVYSANAYLWTRDELDPAANPRQPPTELERERFLSIAKEHFEISTESLQIKLFCR